MDVRKTVDQLDALGIKVHFLALGGVDLTSPAGRMTMGVINSVAEFERDLSIERTQAGLIRAKSEAKTLGRPPRLTADQKRAVVAKLQDGASIARLARDYGVSRLTISRARDNHEEQGKTDKADPAKNEDAIAQDGSDAHPA